MFGFISNQFQNFSASRVAKGSMLISLALASAVLANAKNHDAPPPIVVKPAPMATVLTNAQPRIDVVFALDTTGSMSGLIEGAKQKIWTIMNQMANANTTPVIRVGLVGYRDRGDQYITKRFDLTEDIDAVYEHLQQFAAGGGGDGPESVNQALHEAVMQMSWSQNQDAYKVIFLVGDAPPHMDYQDDVPYEASVKLASEKGIVINTIQCGSGGETARIFASIAALAQGEFASISQDGAMVARHTPMDADLSALNIALAGTVVAYGEKGEQMELRRKLSYSLGGPSRVAASRLSFLSKMGGMITSGRSDLIDALSSKEVDLDEITEDELPEEMQTMSEPERESYLRGKSKERNEIKSKIKELSKSRDAYIAEASRKRIAGGEVGAFDDSLLETIRAQAAKKGIVY